MLKESTLLCLLPIFVYWFITLIAGFHFQVFDRGGKGPPYLWGLLTIRGGEGGFAAIGGRMKREFCDIPNFPLKRF